jgi:U4/U6.U5 tri-snRNP component SNU23
MTENTTENTKATASQASDTDFRKRWDKQEYAEKAKQRDAEERERMQENDERLKSGTSVPS